MFYSWRRDSVHSLKHIPGFMKTAKDGGRRFERKADWLNSPISAIPAFRWKGDFWQSIDVWVSIWAHSSPANYVLIMKYKHHGSVLYTHTKGIKQRHKYYSNLKHLLNFYWLQNKRHIVLSLFANEFVRIIILHFFPKKAQQSRMYQLKKENLEQQFTELSMPPLSFYFSY